MEIGIPVVLNITGSHDYSLHRRLKLREHARLICATTDSDCSAKILTHALEVSWRNYDNDLCHGRWCLFRFHPDL